MAEFQAECAAIRRGLDGDLCKVGRGAGALRRSCPSSRGRCRSLWHGVLLCAAPRLQLSGPHGAAKPLPGEPLQCIRDGRPIIKEGRLCLLVHELLLLSTLRCSASGMASRSSSRACTLTRPSTWQSLAAQLAPQAAAAVAEAGVAHRLARQLGRQAQHRQQAQQQVAAVQAHVLQQRDRRSLATAGTTVQIMMSYLRS